MRVVFAISMNRREMTYDKIMIIDGNLPRVYRSHRGTQRRQNRESDWSGRRSFPGEFSGCSQDVLRPGSAISYLDTRVRHLLVSTNHEYVSFLPGNNNNPLESVESGYSNGFDRVCKLIKTDDHNSARKKLLKRVEHDARTTRHPLYASRYWFISSNALKLQQRVSTVYIVRAKMHTY